MYLVHKAKIISLIEIFYVLYFILYFAIDKYFAIVEVFDWSPSVLRPSVPFLHLVPVICLSVLYSHELFHIWIISLIVTLLSEIVFWVDDLWDDYILTDIHEVDPSWRGTNKKSKMGERGGDKLILSFQEQVEKLWYFT